MDWMCSMHAMSSGSPSPLLPSSRNRRSPKLSVEGYSIGLAKAAPRCYKAEGCFSDADELREFSKRKGYHFLNVTALRCNPRASFRYRCTRPSASLSAA